MTGSESWRDVIGYKGTYQVSNQGRVRSVDRVVSHPRYDTIRRKGQLCKLSTHRDGHITVTLHKEGKRKHFYVHSLVLEAFVELRPKDLQSRHDDGNPSNNYLSNLRWGTLESNQHDRIRHGTANRGERHGRAKLKESQVREIRRLVASGLSQTEVGERFGIAQARVSEIVLRKTWKFV